MDNADVRRWMITVCTGDAKNGEMRGALMKQLLTNIMKSVRLASD
jgi:hypothetical protein